MARLKETERERWIETDRGDDRMQEDSAWNQLGMIARLTAALL